MCLMLAARKLTQIKLLPREQIKLHTVCTTLLLRLHNIAIVYPTQAAAAAAAAQPSRAPGSCQQEGKPRGNAARAETIAAAACRFVRPTSAAGAGATGGALVGSWSSDARGDLASSSCCCSYRSSHCRAAKGAAAAAIVKPVVSGGL